MNKRTNILLFFIGLSLPSFSQEFNEELLKNLPLEIRESVMDKVAGNKNNFEDYELSLPRTETKPVIERDKYGSIIPERFGLSFYKNQSDTFPPQLKTAPASYVLGPGDVLNFNFSGALKYSKKIQINREGQIFIKEIGTINLSGLTYEKAQEEINRITEASLIGSKVDITLSKIRPIQLFIMGNVSFPGSYIVSPLSSVASAIFTAGGPSLVGSNRNILHKRGDKIISNIDLYDLFVNGNRRPLKIQSGDVLLVNPVGTQVKVFGEVKRPAIFELKPNEGFDDILNFVSGVNSNADLNRVSLTRTSSQENTGFSKDYSFEDLSKLKFKDGDQLYFHSIDIVQLDANKDLSMKISLSGAFNNPGVYTLKKGETFSKLLELSGGLTDLAYVEAGVFLREEVKEREKIALKKAADTLENSLVSALTSGQLSEIADPQLALQIMGQFLARLRDAEPQGRVVTDFDINKIREIPELDFVIQNGDSIFMPERKSTVTVTGEILSPTTFTYIESLEAKDYIKLAGGLNKNADKDNIFFILPNGQSVKPKNGWFSGANYISPGTTIVVTRDTTKLSQITLWKAVLPIFSNLVQTLAAIDALSD